ALAALWLNRSSDEVGSANRAIQEICAAWPFLPGYKGYADPKNPAGAKVDGAYDLHFDAGILLSRIYELFYVHGRLPGRITPQTESAIAKLMWDWSRSE